MPKRRTKIPTPTWEHEQTGITRKLEANRWQLWATAGIVFLVVASLGVIGWAFLSDYIDDQQRPGSLGLRVGEREITVRDYTERANLFREESGVRNAGSVLPALSADLIQEALLLQFAGERSVTASDEDVRAEIASRLGIEADDANFDARFAEELARTGLSEEEFTDASRAAVLLGGLTDLFAAEVVDSLPSVNYRQIRLADQQTADGLIEQLNIGADFATLAADNSLDTATKDEGGEVGWVPEGVLGDSLENILFALEANEITTFSSGNAVFIFEVLDKSDSQEVSDESRDSLGRAAYLDWLIEKQESVEVVNELDTQIGNPDKIAYVVKHANLTVQ